MNQQSPLSPPIPKKRPSTITWQDLSGSALSLTIANAAKNHFGITTIITKDMLTANQLEDELIFFIGNDKRTPILNFPEWETLPYDTFSPHQDIISQRLRTLSQLPTLKSGVLIVPIATLMHRIAPREYLSQHSLIFSIGDKINLNQFKNELTKSGYQYVSQVIEHGEFSIRGSIIDLFPMGSETPYRIDLFDDEIDSIRTFDPESQRSIEKIKQIELLPAYEVPLNEKDIQRFRENWRETFSGNPMDCSIYQDISEGHYSPGIEYYLPLFFEKTACLLDYLSEKTLIIRPANVNEQANQFWNEIQYRHDQLCHDRSRPILTPTQMFFHPDEIFKCMQSFSTIRIAEQHTTNSINFALSTPPELNLDHKAKQPLHLLQNFIDQTDARVLFSTDTTGRRESLLSLLKTISVQPKQIQSWAEFLKCKEKTCITVAPINQGLICSDPNIAIISESQLFGQHVIQQRRQKKIQADTDTIIRNLTELHIGDPVVHIDHGVGRFLGLQTLTVGNQTDEYLILEYAKHDKLYVPVSSLHLISRYSGSNSDHTPLHQLGSHQWEKIKRKAAERVRDVAVELLDIYARRAARQGYQFSKPDKHYYTFEKSFPFEETPDQETAINQVIEDMCSKKAMDRLICGDVGFGKTEVAMRATFLAIQNNKQVAILVPTTLLAQQHYETFKNRFADLSIKIEVLSRFRSQKNQTKIIGELKTGKVDIIIGTHKLLKSDIQFHDLGLLIIDEEHRFGVKQKEQLKSLRSEVDILTLTATPIPRTLNMAFSGIRDFSIIATPPQRRLSIKTLIQKPNNHTTREAILREIMRGGQVYYLHNKVDTIKNTAQNLEKLVPEARIAIAHGQMHETELEHVMADFYHRRLNVLVCTTIIETGIDIPSVNTIIIERADKFGLAQLHQLRGRVGRSHRQAYAYLLIPSKDVMTKDAKKRLDAIESLEDLGVGFTLATHDMEIRGAGEFLGEEQSGHMQAVGFTLYMEMLERAVKALKSGQPVDLDKPYDEGIEINLHIPALIPEDYLPDVHLRLILYKRIASASITELDDLRVEMIDRFGLLPQAIQNLFRVTELKLQAAPLGIKKIDVSENQATIEFNETPNIDSSKIIRLVQNHPQKYKFTGSTRLKMTLDDDKVESRIQAIEEFLRKVS